MSRRHSFFGGQILDEEVFEADDPLPLIEIIQRCGTLAYDPHQFTNTRFTHDYFPPHWLERISATEYPKPASRWHTPSWNDLPPHPRKLDWIAPTLDEIPSWSHLNPHLAQIVMENWQNVGKHDAAARQISKTEWLWRRSRFLVGFNLPPDKSRAMLRKVQNAQQEPQTS